MAENIGKVVVSIEAKVEELAAGLARAESMFKKSADKMVAQQAKLGGKFKRSWTELSSKVNILTMALGAAEKAVRVFGEAMVIVGDDSLTSWEKVGGVIESIGSSGIPILSQMVGLSTELAKVAVGYNTEMASIQKIHEDVAGINAFGKIKEQIIMARLELSKFSDILYKSLEDQETMEQQGSDENKLKLKQLRERENLENKYQEIIEKAGESAPQEFLNEEQYKFEMAMQYLKQLQSRETDAFNERLQQEEDLKKEQFERDEKRIKDLADEKEKADKRVASKTMSLQEKLAIMLAKKAGDTAQAQVIAIQSKYRKMLEGATTQDQKDLISMMEKMELEGVGAGGGGGSGGGTTSVSTAVGGFTVATGRSEGKKQTSLLERIADSNQLVADTLTRARESGAIIPPQ